MEPAADLVARGERQFQRCYACHSVQLGEHGLSGPNLAGVFGRRAGADPTFDYSEALKARGAQGMAWRERELDLYLADPAGFIPETSMAPTGLVKREDRDALIAYLKTR